MVAERADKKIGLLCPYFGKLDRDHMKIWFQCCAYNPDIDFILITDDQGMAELGKPENVRLIQMSWEDCKKRIEAAYDFNVPLVYKYKICDLKPAYGELFRDCLEEYDFWGHIDISDTIFGNLRAFITDELLNTYDKIHMYGHLTLYRNIPEVNARYRIPLSTGQSYRDVFTVEETMSFDEMYNEISINQIYKENHYSKIDRVPGLVVDILPYFWSFWLSQDRGVKIPRVLEWNQGVLKEIVLADEQIRAREIGYVHFQKRKISIDLTDTVDHFYLVPNCILPAASVTLTPEWLKQVSTDRTYWAPVVGRVNRIINYAKHPRVFMRKLRAVLKQRK